MLVTRSNFDSVLKRLAQPGEYALDTETNGLAPYKGHRLFSIIIAQGEESWYFNFNHYEELPPDQLLDVMHKLELQRHVFSSPLHTWALHNAKFDMHMLGVEGLRLIGPVFCTYAQARLLHNDLRAYNLDFLAKRWLGAEKSDAVKEYCEEHKLYEAYTKGKLKKKNYHFWRVPLKVVQDYAEKDGTLAFALAAYIHKGLDDLHAARQEGVPSIYQVSENEAALTKVLYEIERVGVQLDKPYAERALEAERRTYQAAAARFKELVGFDLDAGSPSCLARAFKQVGVELPKGASGRELTNKLVLKKIKHEVADLVQSYRKSNKKATTYYANFLAMADEAGVIHPDFHQGGTKTGRLSCRDPNLHNLNRPDEAADDDENVFEVRRCFVPRDGFLFFAPDYDQIEYRLMLEYAEEMGVIKAVLGGQDVHAATAEMLGLKRYDAKQINFMLIYGGGVGKLAEMTNRTWNEAKDVMKLYFSRLPKISAFVEAVRRKASRDLRIFNWFGRVYTFDDPDMTHTTAPNWLIQGGCAEVLKKSLIACHGYLTALKLQSRMVLNVHDEIVFEMHKSELEHCAALVEIMERMYPYKHLKLTAGPAWSARSLADKDDGYPVLS
jgi:DNA polymerase I